MTNSRATWPVAPDTRTPAQQYLTVVEAAKAYRMGPDRLRALIKQGKIKTILLGRRILIRPEAMDEFMLSLEAYR